MRLDFILVLCRAAMDRSLTQRRLTLWVSECVCVKGGGEKEDGKKSIPYSTRTSREKEKETHTKEENYGTTRRLATFRYTSHEAKKNVVYVVVLDDVLKWIPLKSLFSFPPFFFLPLTQSSSPHSTLLWSWWRKKRRRRNRFNKNAFLSFLFLVSF